MKVVKRLSDVRAERRLGAEYSWGFVPTMGYLHEGHLKLVRLARAENERVAVSIFVNPTQFAPSEDLQAYPRDIDHDLDLLERERVDLVFVPEAPGLYPDGFQTVVKVTDITRRLEGASRPTHFQGVTTVVAKLFNIVQPQRAYFGQKDAQQVVVVKRMVSDLNFDLQIVVGPTVRESDGLAMSSRNARLTPEQRDAAPILYRALSAARTAIGDGERNGEILREAMEKIIHSEPRARLDYVSVAHPWTLEELAVLDEHALLSGAIFLGEVRLIDNIPI